MNIQTIGRIRVKQAAMPPGSRAYIEMNRPFGQNYANYLSAHAQKVPRGMTPLDYILSLPDIETEPIDATQLESIALDTQAVGIPEDFLTHDGQTHLIHQLMLQRIFKQQHIPLIKQTRMISQGEESSTQQEEEVKTPSEKTRERMDRLQRRVQHILSSDLLETPEKPPLEEPEEEVLNDAIEEEVLDDATEEETADDAKDEVIQTHPDLLSFLS